MDKGRGSPGVTGASVPESRLSGRGEEQGGAARASRSDTVVRIGAAVGIAALLGSAGFYLWLDAATLLPAVVVELATAGVLLAVFRLDRKGHRLAASLVMNVFVAFPIFLNTLLFFGHDFGFQYILVFCAILPSISVVTERWWIPFLLTLVDIGYFFATFAATPLFDLSRAFPSATVAGIGVFSNVLAILCIVATVGFYQLTMIQHERKLERRSTSLTTSLEKVYVGGADKILDWKNPGGSPCTPMR